MKTKKYTTLFLTVMMALGFAATAKAVAPSNDNLAQAAQIMLTGDLVTVHSTNVEATREVGEPFHYAGTPGESSVWYKWTAAETRAMQIELADSFSSSFSVYTSSTMVPAFASLTRVNASRTPAAIMVNSRQGFFPQPGPPTISLSIRQSCSPARVCSI